jgi:hypothetical protein
MAYVISSKRETINANHATQVSVVLVAGVLYCIQRRYILICALSLLRLSPFPIVVTHISFQGFEQKEQTTLGQATSLAPPAEQSNNSERTNWGEQCRLESETANTLQCCSSTSLGPQRLVCLRLGTMLASYGRNDNIDLFGLCILPQFRNSRACARINSKARPRWAMHSGHPTVWGRSAVGTP